MEAVCITQLLISNSFQMGDKLQYNKEKTNTATTGQDPTRCLAHIAGSQLNTAQSPSGASYAEAPDLTSSP